MRELVVILVLVIGLLLAWAGWSRARRIKKRDEQVAADRELCELLDEWNRKHRPDFWARGGEWPGSKDSGPERLETTSA